MTAVLIAMLLLMAALTAYSGIQAISMAIIMIHLGRHNVPVPTREENMRNRILPCTAACMSRVCITNDYDTVIEKIRLVMRRENIQVNDVAKVVFLTPSALSKKFTGKAEFYIREILAICDYIGIDVMWRER